VANLQLLPAIAKEIGTRPDEIRSCGITEVCHSSQTMICQRQGNTCEIPRREEIAVMRQSGISATATAYLMRLTSEFIGDFRLGSWPCENALANHEPI
jgi:hypothetical protein